MAFGSSSFGTTNSFSSSGGFGVNNSSSTTGLSSFGTNSTFGGVSGSSGFGGGSSSFGGTNLNPNNHFLIPKNIGPEDTVQQLKWSPTMDLLLSASWDGNVRAHQISSGGYQQANCELKTKISLHQNNVKSVPFDICYRNDGQGFFTASTDGKIYWLDFNSVQSNTSSGLFGNSTGNTGGNLQVCGQHSAPVRTVHWMPEHNILVSSSMDSTIKFWDLRTSLNNANAQAAHTITLPDRVCSMDIQLPFCVALTANRGLYVYDMSNLGNIQIVKQLKGAAAPLKRQYRVVKISPDKSCYIIGSIEGRVSVQYLPKHLTDKTFTFKCHRDKENKIVYPINDICFHPKYFTFATLAGDGIYQFWDKGKRVRLELGKALMVQTSSGTQPYSLTSGSFSTNGDKFAYAAGYDWSMGLPGRQNLGNAAESCILIRSNCDQVTDPSRST